MRIETEILRKALKGGSLSEIIQDILKDLKRSVDANYIVITIWDTDKNIPYFHAYISDDNVEIPPAKPGMSALGVCMLEKKPIRGDFSLFPKAEPKLKNIVGKVFCLPVEIPEEKLLGAIGIGRKIGRPDFDEQADSTLRAITDIISAVISIKVLQDLLAKERQLLSGFSRLLSRAIETEGTLERFDAIMEDIMDLFNADYAILGRIVEEKKVVKPIIFKGFDRTELLPIPFGEGISGIAAQEKKVKFFRRYPKKIPKGYEKEAAIVGSALSSPIEVDNQLEFVLTIARSKEKEPFSTSDLYLFHLFQKVLSLVFTLQKREEEKENLMRIKSRVERLDSIVTLAGGIAHDFNNIINIIMGYAQLGLELVEDPQAKEFFKHIFNQCKHAADITSQILLASRAKSKEKDLLDLKLLVKGARDFLKRTLPENIEIVYEDDGHQHYYIKGNPSFIHSTLLNLASNAKDAMPNGGRLILRLRKEEKPKAIDAERAVVLEVEDTGKGIPPEILDKIFDPFFTTKEPGKGTGLGLSQVYQTVRSLGGVIDVKSTPGKGTKFIIYLPEVKTEEEKFVSNQTLQPLHKPQAVLLVEDNQELFELAKRMLEKLEIKVYGSTDPEKALKIFKANADKIELIITDVVMPKISGIELVSRITQEKPDIKVIFMTGYTDKISILQEYSKGKNYRILLKPFSLEELARTVESFFKN